MKYTHILMAVALLAAPAALAKNSGKLPKGAVPLTEAEVHSLYDGKSINWTVAYALWRADGTVSGYYPKKGDEGFADGTWTVTVPSGAPEQFASVGANNNFYPTLLPDNAKPLQSSELEIPKDGMRVLSSDSRFNSAFVCFSSGSGTAPSCFSEAR